MSTNCWSAKEHPCNQRPSTMIEPWFPILFWSNADTSLSSSMAMLSILADFYLKALRKVSGWRRSPRLTGYARSCFCWTLVTHYVMADPFLQRVRSQLDGLSGPSHCFSQAYGTWFLSSAVASLSIFGVNISVPWRTFTMLWMLSWTIPKMRFVETISMNTNWSTGSGFLKSWLETLVFLNNWTLKMFPQSWQIGDNYSDHFSLSNLSSYALTAWRFLSPRIT